MIDLATVEVVDPFAALGVHAFTTTRATGDFALEGDVAAAPNRARWEALAAAVAPRLASARQVHGTTVLTHGDGWTGWRRVEGADGHVALHPGTAVAVTVADCIPVFLAHPGGAVALLHAGWRGVAGRILDAGLDVLGAAGVPAQEVHVHLGPGISGRRYEVGPDVYEQLTGWQTQRARHVDLRALLAEQARERGVARVTASGSCTSEDNARFFSARAGDAGRQVAVVVRPQAAGHRPP